MARSTLIIQQQILDNIAADPTLGPLLTSTSKRAIFTLLAFIIATAVNLLEQLIDIFTLNVESIAATAATATTPWVQAQMFKFQYSATNPQIVQLIGFAPAYPIIDPSLQIITACSVTSDVSNGVAIKIAKGNPFAALSGPELSSAQAYINTIGIAGITYTASSLSPDNIYINANIYYQGQFSGVIQNAVITAINNYLQLLSKINFDGSLKMSDLEEIIRSVPGVDDVVFLNIRGRAATDLFAAGIDLILNQTLIQRSWKTISGYIIGETTAGKTFADSLNFVAE